MTRLNIQYLDQINNNAPSVIITGITGQDGSLMADYLLRNTNYIIYGGARPRYGGLLYYDNITHLKDNPRFKLIDFDLTDVSSISKIIKTILPKYFINFAAQSFVKSSWDMPIQTWETNTTGVLNILESIRLNVPSCRFYNAGSSEEFGNVLYSPQNEQHPSRPRSPYGASKAASRQLIKVYRESYNLYAIQGWLFNHESIRRGENFVTRKITKGVAKIYKELTEKTTPTPTPIELGNLDVVRDWSDAEDMIDAVWRMLNQDIYHHELVDKINNNDKFNKQILPYELISEYNAFIVKNLKEYVVGSGVSHTIREFVVEAFKCVDIYGKWVKGTDETDEVFISTNNEILVKINKSHYRTAEVDYLHSDPSLIKSELNWAPKTTFESLIEKMVLNDLK